MDTENFALLVQGVKEMTAHLRGEAMRYPIAIEPGDDTHAWGVVVPDLPGCFSAGTTLDGAIK